MKKGKIFLVGFGPGSKEQMTGRAVQAIAESDVVVGYSTYIKLVEDLLEGKEVIKKGMTEEIDRSIMAYERALEGKTVALISSGDIGVYGMAGPTYEVLLEKGWTPKSDITVEVVPGTTALSACASLVGAPLTHDFCSISLSDLLTPWSVIASRLKAAAESDFVIALYNPKSGRRTEQIVEAQQILLKYRSPETPVALVKSAYRKREQITLSTLEELQNHDIGMLTTVLIGNSSTFIQEGLLITPRGYANKYENLTGDVKAGEQAGRSLQLGLEGLQEYVQAELEGGQSPDQLAREFHLPLQKVFEFAAPSQFTAASQGGAFQSKKISSDNLLQVWGEIAGWGKLRALIYGIGGAVTECMTSHKEFELQEGRLNLIREDLHLHIPWKLVKACYLTSYEGKYYRANFVDQQGNLVFRLSLQKEEGRFLEGDIQAFQAAGHLGR